MILGGVGTIIINLIYGFASFAGTFSTFALIWLLERLPPVLRRARHDQDQRRLVQPQRTWYSFAGIYGFMIQARPVHYQLSWRRLILAGFTLGVWVVAKKPMAMALPHPAALCHSHGYDHYGCSSSRAKRPEEAGYHRGASRPTATPAPAAAPASRSQPQGMLPDHLHAIRWSGSTPLAYACTGAVRHSSDQLCHPLLHPISLHLDMKQPSQRPSVWTLLTHAACCRARLL